MEKPKRLKTGGRVKGSRNKDRAFLFDELYAKAPKLNVLLKFIEIAESTDNELLKFSCYKELAKYTLPQLRSIEVKDDSPQNNQMNIIRFVVQDNETLENINRLSDTK